MTDQPTPLVPGKGSSDEVNTGVNPVEPSETRTPLYLATNSARYQRQEIIRKIQERTQRPLVCYVSGIRCGIDRDDILPFFDIIHNVKPGKSVDLLLHTPGGSADVAEKLIRTLRGRVGEAQIHIIVPDFA